MDKNWRRIVGPHEKMDNVHISWVEIDFLEPTL